MLDFLAWITYALNEYKELSMPRTAVDNSRLALRIKRDDKAMIMRAVALRQTDLTHFILGTVIKEAQAVIEEAEHLKLSQRDSLRVLEILESPPQPNAKLRKAARDLPERS